MRRTAAIVRPTGSFDEAMAREAQIVGTSRDEFIFINDISLADTAEGGAGDDVILGDRAPDAASPLLGIDSTRQDAWNLHVIQGTVRRTAQSLHYEKVFRGGTGDDWLAPGCARDVAHGGDGDDVIYGEGGEDELHGGDGDDVVSGDNLSDASFAFGRLDDHGDDVIDGGRGDDLLFGNLGDDRLSGGEGNDVLHGDDPAAAAWRSGDDELWGGDGEDLLFGGAGDDQLSGDDGNDVLIGGQGNDTLVGGGGNDCLYSDSHDPGAPAPLVHASAHMSTLMVGLHVGQTGTGVQHMKLLLERIEALGPDRDGRHAVNQLYGGGGNDLLVSGGGNDWLDGGEGNDRLSGGAGDDVLDGGTGNDRLSGGAGNDQLQGGDGKDRLSGGAGDDVLDGGAGNDLLKGGRGNDVYHIVLGGGADTIVEADDRAGGEDRVQFGDGIVASQLQARVSGQDLVIHLNATDSVTLQDWFQGSGRRVEQLLLSNGVAIDVDTLVAAIPQPPLTV